VGWSEPRRGTRTAFAAVTLLLLSTPALTQTRGGAPEEEEDAYSSTVGDVQLYRETHAIIIGIDRYPELSEDDQLEYAVRDAEAVEATLRERFEFSSITTLYDQEATRIGIEKVFSTASRELGKDDALFIFWAGHGIVEDSRFGKLGYLVPYDGNRVDMLSRNISMGYLRDTVFRSVRAKHIFLVVDACYGGLFAETRDLEAESMDPQHSPEYLEEITGEHAVLVLTAGKEDQQVLDGGGSGADGEAHSVFTMRFLEALSGARDFITAKEIGHWIKPRVLGDASRQGKKQTPVFRPIWGVGDFVFVPKALPAIGAADKDPGDRSSGPEGLLIAGWSAYETGRYEEAVDLGVQAIQKNPGLTEALLLRGLAHERLGNTGRAQVLLDLYVEMAPERAQETRLVAALGRLSDTPRHDVPTLSTPPDDPTPESTPAPHTGIQRQPSPETRTGAGLISDIRGVEPAGGSGAWDAEVGRMIVAAFDTDGSGLVDQPDELAAVPCDVYRVLDDEIHESWRYGLRVIYGFEWGGYIGTVLGFGESIRVQADEAIVRCLGVEPPRPEGEEASASTDTLPGAEEVLRLPGEAGTPTWEGAVLRHLVTDFDLNGSGRIDNAAEVSALPCGTWLALEFVLQEDDRSLIDYGFTGGDWYGDRLGFDRKVKADAISALEGCVSSQ